MEEFGYLWDSESELPEKLRETTLACTKQELDLLIAFLQNVRDEAAPMQKFAGEHWHYRDWLATWPEKGSDFIVLLNDGSANETEQTGD